MDNNLSISSEDYEGTDIYKSLNPDVEEISGNYLTKANIDEFIHDVSMLQDNCSSVDILEKAKKDLSRLSKKQVWVTRNGKSYMTTVWVNTEGEDVSETKTGENVVADLNGLDIKRHTDKSVLITGDTYGNLETLREIKKETGVGAFNRALKGWIFPFSQLSTILGKVVEKMENADEEDPEGQDPNNAVARDNITELKNAFAVGSRVETPIGKGTISNASHNGSGVVYDLKMDTGKHLKGMSKEDFTLLPETDAKKAGELIKNATPENRKQTGDSLFGNPNIKQIEIDSAPKDKKEIVQDLQKKRDAFIKRLKNLSSSKPKGSSGGGSKAGSSGTSGRSSMTKAELNAALEANGMMTVDEYYKEVFGEHYVSQEESQRRSDAMRGNQNAKKDGVPEEDPKPEPKQPEPEKEKEEESEPEKKEEGKPKKKEEPEITDDGLVSIDIKGFEPKNKTIKDQNGNDIEVTDMSHAPIKEMKMIKPKDVLNYKHPNFIPQIDEDVVRNRKYWYESIKLEDGNYLIQTEETRWNGATRFTGTGPDRKSEVVNVEPKYTLVSKEQFAYMYHYNIDVAKAKERVKAEERTERAKQHWESMSEERKARYSGYKKYGPKRLKVMGKDRYLAAQNDMFKQFIKKDAVSMEIHLNIMKQKEDLDITWNNFTVSNEDYSGTWVKGKETSYAKKGSIDVLVDSHGVNVKRQDGSEIGSLEVQQIQNNLDSIYSIFGNRKEMAKKFDLTVSHAGEKRQHASKAIGVFIPKYNAIGVSMVDNDDQFGFTMAHEFAHFMDYHLAEKEGTKKYFASHDESHIAGKIADAYRENMNDRSLRTHKYQGNSHECFARALEQYYAMSSGRNLDLDSKKMTKDPNRVDAERFNNNVKPLVEQLLKEKDHLLKSIIH